MRAPRHDGRLCAWRGAVGGGGGAVGEAAVGSGEGGAVGRQAHARGVEAVRGSARRRRRQWWWWWFVYGEGGGF